MNYRVAATEASNVRSINRECVHLALVTVFRGFWHVLAHERSDLEDFDPAGFRVAENRAI